MSKANELSVVYDGVRMIGFVPQAEDVLVMCGNRLELVRNGATIQLVYDNDQGSREVWDELFPRIEAANAR